MKVRLELELPVRVEGSEYLHLEMRRPKVRDERDARRAGDDAAVQEIALFANLCEVPPSVIEELDMADYRRLQDVYRGFAGPKASPPGAP